MKFGHVAIDKDDIFPKLMELSTQIVVLAKISGMSKDDFITAMNKTWSSVIMLNPAPGETQEEFKERLENMQ